MSLLQINHLETSFRTENGIVPAVRDISFDLERGQTLCIVGESGCGKSVTALSIMRLLAADQARISGEILFEDQNLLTLSEKHLQKIRGNDISMVFQEPMTSLNPTFTIGNQLSEVFMLHQKKTKREAYLKSIEMLRLVGITSDARMKQYPHQLSGGMRQRVMIAMALACKPKILIADEPTTALDVTIQSQILRLISSLQRELGMAMILITHNLGIVSEVANDVIVMYAGKIVEKAPTKKILFKPAHPYTMGLLKSIPRLNEEKKRLYTIPGSVPSLLALPRGCSFQNRCSYATEICRQSEPPLIRTEVDPTHTTACFHYKEITRT